jgi:protein arginine kinase activator
MKCQFCANPATVHLTKITDLTNKTVVHLCDDCAKKQHLLQEPKPELNLPALLHLLLGPHLSPASEELSRLTCPACGIKYMEFRGEGRLGCPADYDVFRLGLEPILQRVHRATEHVGKVPPNRHANAARQTELLDLHAKLREAIRNEAFEEAARLRDLIRAKEVADESR